MSVPKSKYKVYIYKNDYNAVCAEVYRHQHIETGGNLFGLWTASGDAIIHVALGPGRNCKRTSTSFHQDLEYMARVGRFVNDGYMLCHIGEWHSHHNLSLSKPSAGDESTVRRNFPRGISKFLVIIANIRNYDTIKLSPYFFTNGGTRYEIAKHVVLDSDSPFSTDDVILPQINFGAEGKENAPRPETNSKPPLDDEAEPMDTNDSDLNPPGDEDRSSASPEDATRPEPRDALVNSSSSDCWVDLGMPPSTAYRILVKPQSPDVSTVPSTPRSDNSPGEPPSDDHEEAMGTEDSDLKPPEDDGTPSASPENVTTTPEHDASAEDQNDTGKKLMNVDEESKSERKIILDKIYDSVKFWFGNQAESMLKYETSKNTPGADEVSFNHNSKHWMIRFPKDFPTKPAELFYSYQDNYNDYDKCSDSDIFKPLTNPLNILLTIKTNCGTCKVCKYVTTESGLSPHSKENLSIFLNKLVDSLATSLFVDALHINEPSFNTTHTRVTFKHANKSWTIVLPAQFPDIPAKVWYLPHEGNSQHYVVLLCPKSSSDPQDLNTIELIIHAIQLAI